MNRSEKKFCPICGRSAPWEGNPYKPFCSKRCKIIDLGGWASGGYRVPGEKVDIEKEDNEIKDER